MTTTTVVFDLDGTLVHSAPDLAYAANLMLAELSAPALPIPKIEAMIGNGIPKLVERALEASGIDLQDIDFITILESFTAHYEANLTRETQLYPGVEELLVELKGQGYNLAICTNKKQAPAEAICDALNLTQYFDSIIGADDGREHKPHAEPLLLAIQLAGGDPDKAILIGDSRADAECAVAANVPGVLVDFGYTTTPVTELPSVAVISDIRDVKPILTNLDLQI
ncbi:MAG: phosphoglycolate phosphatase [Rhizobiaceae bacterium]